MSEFGSNIVPSLEENEEPPILIPCTVCGRTFKSESLKKHQGVCQKNATKKRKVFDSMKQRIQGTELAEYISIPVPHPKPKLSVHKGGNKSKVGESYHNTNTPGSIEKSRPVVRSNSVSTSTPSRGAAFKEEKCPHCDRTFGWKAFSRHEEWCKEHKTRVAQSQSPASVLKAKEMLEARIKYRAPLVGKLKRPTNREKYAHGAGVIGVSPMTHSYHKSSVTEVHHQKISSPKSIVSNSNKENRSKSTPKTSTVSCPGFGTTHHQQVARKVSAPVKREPSPPKEITHIINPPWDLNISSEEVEESKESSSDSRNSSEDERSAVSPLEKPSFRLSTYDPFSKAEMQLRELLSDGHESKSPKIILSSPLDEEQKKQVPDNHNSHALHIDSSHKNGNLHLHNIFNNQKQAKEDILPDLFTETSTHLHFEMPNLMRGREETVMTKRRAMKPTALNMGIDLNPSSRENPNMRRNYLSKSVDVKFDNNQKYLTSSSDIENEISKKSHSPNSNSKMESGDHLDIDSIHQSINLVALGLSNLSTNSNESLVDVDNNNAVTGEKNLAQKTDDVDSSGNLIAVDQKLMLPSHTTHPPSSGESDGDAKRVRRRKRRGKTLQEGETREDISSPESLVAFQNCASAKLSVDSAYSSLNRPSFRNLEDCKRVINKAFDHHQHQNSSEGENDHADEWSEDEDSKKRSSKWKPDPPIIDLNDCKLARFCHECGSKYPLTEARFCCVCGARRLAV